MIRKFTSSFNWKLDTVEVSTVWNGMYDRANIHGVVAQPCAYRMQVYRYVNGGAIVQRDLRSRV